jgi:uncharacterized protein YvpB
MHVTKRKIYFWICGGIAAIILVSLGIWTYLYLNKPFKITYSLDNLKINSPIAVGFNQPIQDHVNYNISPSLEGSWKIERNPLGITALKFQPAKTLVPGTNYKLTLGHVVPLMATKPAIDDQTIPVAVEKPAAIASMTPGTNGTNVPVNTSVTVKLASPNSGMRELQLVSDAPLTSPAPTSNDDTTFTWKFAQPLQQGHAYKISLNDLKQSDKTKQVLLDTSFTTVPEPHITTATNREHFYPGDKITIAFDQDMKPTDTDFKFNFNGSGRWSDARTYEFTPSGLAAGGSYTYSVLKGSTSTGGGVIEADHPFTITPPGAVFVSGLSPSGGNVAVGSSINVTFDQPVDHTSAQAAFSISPATTGTFSWSGNTMIFKPSGLGYQTGYTVAVKPGVKGTYGLPGTKAFSGGFTTTYQVIKLGVPAYHQVYSLSCEAAALRMILAYRGINVTDYDILMRMNYNPRPRDTGSNSWDNPYQMFVGDVNGQQGTTGWGTYGPVVSSAAQSFGRSASYVNGISANQIAQAIHSNNPVVVWGFSGSTFKPDSWNTSSGVVQVARNEHTRTVYGVAGSPANPIGFYLHDPYFGDIYWTTAQLQWNMSLAGTSASQGVIVY